MTAPIEASDGAGFARINAVFIGLVGLTLLALAGTVRSVALVPAALFIAIIAIDHVWTRAVLGRIEFEGTASDTIVSIGSDVIVRTAMLRGGWGTRILVGGTHGTPIHQGRADISYPATHVGVRHTLPVTVQVAGIGVASAARTIEIPLSRPLHCGPRLDGSVEPIVAAVVGGESATRSYVPGDRPNRINWAATARTGDLLVRADGHDEDELIIVIDSTNADAQDLDWLWRPASTITTWWDARGGPVRLITTEESTTRSAGTRSWPIVPRLVDAAVHDRRELLRRLASVVPSPTAAHQYSNALVFVPPVTP